MRRLRPDGVERALEAASTLVGMDPDTPDIGAAWARVQAALPDGWTIDSLRCASEGLAVGQRSDDWVAVAVGPGGEERRARAADPAAALDALPGAIG